MSDTIGPDGLTDEERGVRGRLASDFLARWTSNYAAKVLDALAAERLAHAAEKAAHAETRAERDQERAARERAETVLRRMVDGCPGCGGRGWVIGVGAKTPCTACLEARAALSQEKEDGKARYERDEWKARAEKAEAQNARMREVLLRNATDHDGFCLDCGADKQEKHDRACIVAELLREK